MYSCDDYNNINNKTNSIITIGTFNIQWLGDGFDDENPRSEEEIKELANIISSSKIDLLALQEIENSKALERIIYLLNDYKFEILNTSSKQNLAVIYKKNIEIKSLGAYDPLALNKKTRAGLLLNIKINEYNFDAMIVHLKSTSRYDSTAQLREESREMRYKQAEIISNWADSMMFKAGKKELVILGDFNDYPTRKNNTTLDFITNNPNLYFLTENNVSCSNSNWFAIDHIVVSSETKKRFVPNSVFTYDFYSSLPDEEARKISDHCPVSVQLYVNTTKK